MTKDPIIKNEPKAYQARAKRLIGHLQDNTGVSWNSKGESSLLEKVYKTLTSQSYKRYNKESET